ncbi:MAG: flagellar export protein FliJ [Phycisphaerae bacterium]|nr:flagellar export protein FliJ [Phycisphaerae bacterium]
MAKQFVFRLETLLKLRKQREDRQKRVVAERLRQITRTQDEIRGLEWQIVGQVSAMRDEAAQPRLDAQNLAKNRHWLSRLHRSRLEADAHLRLLEARLAQERAVLAQAARDKKVMEKLKERQRERYLQGLDRQEMIAADDLTITRFLFNRAVDEAATT